MKAFFADLQEDPIFKGAPNANPTRREPEIDLPGYELMDQVEKIWLSTKDKAGRDKELAPLRKQFRRTLISKTSDPEIVRVLARGSWMDETGEIVDPAVPIALVDAQPEPKQGERLSRLDLAKWLVDRKNPLTARVFVNRLWRQFHGAGLSKVLDDLGNQGEWPVHPELLDWLAVEFMESGWDVKHMVKLMVTSSTYRQSSTLRPELKDRDPFNRLVARQSNWRLPAEMIRDNILEVSGLLHHQLGGPSVRPYQPAGYYAHLNFPPRKYQASKGKDLYRRGLYTHWQRMFVHPAMLAFDAPTREECIAERPTSNTPLAPLVMLNDPSYVEAARSFATNAIKLAPEGGEKRVAWMFRQAINRLPSAKEMEIVKELVRSEATRFEADPKAAGQLVAIGELPAPDGIEAKELATWMVLARTLHNLHETITRM